ncbi:MAG: excalibur calcium-binding domain-containing protein [Hyphomonadaceae bacterium]
MATLRQQLQLKRALRRVRTWAPPISIGVIVGAGGFLLMERLDQPPTTYPSAEQPRAEAAVFEQGPVAFIESARSAASQPYPNCDAARAAGAAPLHPGDPGFGPHLDADRDGVACEPFHER